MKATDRLRDAAQQLPPFDDIRVQAAYKILTDDEMPEDKSEHWEGYQARRIVAALAQQDAQKKHKPLFAEMIAQHPGLAEELAQQDAQAVPQGEAIVEEFSAWLNERRGMSVAWVFHDVVAKFRAMFNAAPPQPVEKPVAMKTHGAWDGLELLDGLPDGTCLYAAPMPQVSDVTEAVTKTVIEVEKMLCEKLGKPWQPSGMSIKDLVDELATTHQHFEEIKKWKERGEALFSEPNYSLGFHLGVWWADRPWRTK